MEYNSSSIGLFPVIAIVVVIYAAVSFLYLPQIRVKLLGGGTPSQLYRWTALYSIASIVRGFCICALIACLIIGLFFSFLYFKSGAVELQELNNAKFFFSTFSGYVNSITPFVWLVAIGLLLGGMTLVAQRSSRIGMEKKIAYELNRRREELLATASSEGLPDLPPNDAMNKILGEISTATDQLDKLNESGLSKEIEGDRQKAIEILEERIGQLTHGYHLADIDRRILKNDLQIVNWSEELGDNNGWFTNLLMDIKTVEIIGQSSKWMITTGLVLALLSTVGLMSHSTDSVYKSELKRINLLLLTIGGTEDIIEQNVRREHKQEAVKKEAAEIEEATNNNSKEVESIADLVEDDEEDLALFDTLNSIGALISNQSGRMPPPSDSDFPPGSPTGGRPTPDAGTKKFDEIQNKLKDRQILVADVLNHQKKLAREFNEQNNSIETIKKKHEEVKERLNSLSESQSSVAKRKSELGLQLANFEVQLKEDSNRRINLKSTAEQYPNTCLLYTSPSPRDS